MIDVSLVMFKADGSRRDFPIVKPKVVVGRKNDCDLRIPLTSVSRQHCEIEVRDGQVKLRDLGSSNGTYHNSTRIQESALAAGDEIVIGPVVFTVRVNGMPEQIKPVRTIVDPGGASSDSRAGMRSADSAIPLEEDDLVLPATTAEEEEMTPTVDLDDPLEGLKGAIEVDDQPLILADEDQGDDDQVFGGFDDSDELQIIDEEPR